ncbi:hypothetical protein OGAPHI_004363 [Ogataea philodendri]|uniref:Uncharacterized protein n=1 Tax=Ogataea philodendri TaxID=1378263 RepID=A0A9P8P740_9ASCO|nr:uncharacterized protein OGAPHI_004363 [Ogataea philodendri]KAH3666174.1 hypothetical protein OGAPHI_004363 [Ogataea philodendri]
MSGLRRNKPNLNALERRNSSNPSLIHKVPSYDSDDSGADLNAVPTNVSLESKLVSMSRQEEGALFNKLDYDTESVISGPKPTTSTSIDYLPSRSNYEDRSATQEFLFTEKQRPSDKIASTGQMVDGHDAIYEELRTKGPNRKTRFFNMRYLENLHQLKTSQLDLLARLAKDNEFSFAEFHRIWEDHQHQDFDINTSDFFNQMEDKNAAAEEQIDELKQRILTMDAFTKELWEQTRTK